ncbi:MAG: hypothetical protein K0Q87_4811 [Neobacillus sp.]|jgi:hypothetical protein|nr:hypothetical protein [Neobacillus sp.]
MFTKKITDSDAFIEMSSAAQALYFHLNQSADDDGFNNQIQMAMFRSHASVDDLKVLMMKNFIIRFESGVIVIKHWRMHNTLRKDRYNPTNFQDELALLNIKDNGAYSLSLNDGCQAVANPVPQVSIGKVSIDKDNKKNSSRFAPPSVDEVSEYCKSRNNNIDAEQFVAFYTSKDWKVGNQKMKDWKAAVVTWEKRNRDKGVRHAEPSNNSGNGKPVSTTKSKSLTDLMLEAGLE